MTSVGHIEKVQPGPKPLTEARAQRLYKDLRSIAWKVRCAQNLIWSIDGAEPELEITCTTATLAKLLHWAEKANSAMTETQFFEALQMDFEQTLAGRRLEKKGL